MSDKLEFIYKAYEQGVFTTEEFYKLRDKYKKELEIEDKTIIEPKINVLKWLLNFYFCQINIFLRKSETRYKTIKI